MPIDYSKWDKILDDMSCTYIIVMKIETMQLVELNIMSLKIVYQCNQEQENNNMKNDNRQKKMLFKSKSSDVFLIDNSLNGPFNIIINNKNKFNSA